MAKDVSKMKRAELVKEAKAFGIKGANLMPIGALRDTIEHNINKTSGGSTTKKTGGKKRGRPRKEDTAEPKKKRGRGRPRKSESTPDEAPKKKRGRPRKTKEPEEAPKKRRGRPPKKDSEKKAPARRGRPPKAKATAADGKTEVFAKLSVPQIRKIAESLEEPMQEHVSEVVKKYHALVLKKLNEIIDGINNLVVICSDGPSTPPPAEKEEKPKKKAGKKKEPKPDPEPDDDDGGNTVKFEIEDLKKAKLPQLRKIAEQVGFLDKLEEEKAKGENVQSLRAQLIRHLEENAKLKV